MAALNNPPVQYKASFLYPCLGTFCREILLTCYFFTLTVSKIALWAWKLQNMDTCLRRDVEILHHLFCIKSKRPDIRHLSFFHLFSPVCSRPCCAVRLLSLWPLTEQPNTESQRDVQTYQTHPVTGTVSEHVLPDADLQFCSLFLWWFVSHKWCWIVYA